MGVLLANPLMFGGQVRSPEFYCELIEVRTSDKFYWPIAFSWRGKKYLVSEVIESWQDWGFGTCQIKKKNWRLRHHRNYFLVRTDSNEVFKLYYDRGTKIGAPRAWVLLTKEV